MKLNHLMKENRIEMYWLSWQMVKNGKRKKNNKAEKQKKNLYYEIVIFFF